MAVVAFWRNIFFNTFFKQQIHLEQNLGVAAWFSFFNVELLRAKETAEA